MIIKCKTCGIEYSYGRNICHVCDNNTLFFGAIFEEPRKAYQWNCDLAFNYSDVSIKEHESYEVPLEVISEKKILK